MFASENERIWQKQMAKQKYYVVWDGINPGIYSSWNDCLLQVKGYEGAKYKSFDSQEEAKQAFASSPYTYIGKRTLSAPKILPECIVKDSLAVDAACSGNPGAMEYRGVYIKTNEEIFHFGPMKGTNNIGEFLALVHGLALLKKKDLSIPIYSDSANAISWIKQKKCKTKLPRTQETEELFRLIERAEIWLKQNTFSTRIIKWETKEWGEIPADFGRK